MGAGGVGTMICTAEAVLPAQRGGAGRTSLSSCSVPQAPSTMLGSKAASTGGGGGFPRSHVKLKLGGGSKLSLSHRLKWWQLLWLASDAGRCPNGCQSLMLTARAWQDHVLGWELVCRGDALVPL